MGEKSRRPAGSPERLEETVVCEMVRLKERHRAWGPRKIREVYLRLHGSAPSEHHAIQVAEDVQVRAGIRPVLSGLRGDRNHENADLLENH